MLNISVKADIKRLEAYFSAVQKNQLPFAVALALTKTAQHTQYKLRQEMKRVFDRPKPYTLNSTFVRPATKRSLVAEVKIKDDPFPLPPVKWIKNQVYGGDRRFKAFEKLMIEKGVMPPGTVSVPAKSARLDAYGNLSPGQLMRILSDLSAQRDPLNNATREGKAKRARSRRKRNAVYFSTYPVTPRVGHLKPGVYERVNLGFGSAIRPVMLFVGRAGYAKRFRFYELGEQIARARFPWEFEQALRQAVKTAR